MSNDDLILTRSDVWLIKAAIRFWIDEMPEGDASVIAPYLDSISNAEAVTRGQSARLLMLLDDCRVRYVQIDHKGDSVPQEQLLDRPEDAGPRRDGQSLATVLSLG